MSTATKQKAATAFLAVLIVASVLCMPGNGHGQQASRGAAQRSGAVSTAKLNGAELAHEQVKDFTYN